MLDTMMIWFFTALSGGAGAFFGTYLRKKAEFTALREDFAEMKKQLAETTAVSESVKIQLGGGYWLAQEKWKLRRDLFQSLLNSVAETGELIREIRDTANAPDEKERIANDPELLAKLHSRVACLNVDIRKAKAAAQMVSPRAVALVKQLTELSATVKAGEEEALMEAILVVVDSTYAKLAALSREEPRLDLG